MNALQIKAKALREKQDAAKALLEKESLTPEETEQVKSLTGEIKALREEIETVKALVDETKTANDLLTTAVPTVTAPDSDTATKSDAASTKVVVLPAHAPVTAFTGRDDYEKGLKAMRFGHFMLGAVVGRTVSLDYCKSNGIEIKAQSEGTSTAGGVLVPDEFSTDLIKLMDDYGTFRAAARKRVMARDTLSVPRRTAGVTAYFTSEAAAATESSAAWDAVNFVAKKLTALTLHSEELAQDAIIDVAGELIDEIAMAFAEKEDRCGWIGDASSTYGGILGVLETIKKQVTDLSGTWTTDAEKLYAAGVTNAAGNLWSEVTTANMSAVKARVAAFAYKKARAGQGAVRWYCSQAFFHEVLERLILAAGGAQAAEIVAGMAQPRFLGYPVEFCEVLPQSEGASTVPVYFGNLSLAASFGDRREMTVSRSDQYKWAEGQLAIKGTERFDIIVHDIGTGHATRTSQTLGPIACLALNNA